MTVGDVRNLISEFDSRHPSVFNEGIQAGNDHGQLKSRRLAISSVYTGLFIGMNDWRRILVGDLPGRLSTNNCYQATAKSPIELVRLAKVKHCITCACVSGSVFLVQQSFGTCITVTRAVTLPIQPTEQNIAVLRVW